MRERIIYIDILRILATFAVVFAHSAAFPIYDNNLNTINWQFGIFYGSLTRWCVPMFVMISGVFFLQNERGKNYNQSIKSEYKKIISKNIFRISTALIIWGMFYGTINLIRESAASDSFAISPVQIVKIFYNIIFGIPHYHLWFLYLIIGLYILSPLLKIFVANATKTTLELFLLLFLSFGVGLNLINSFLEIFNFKGFYFSEILPEFSGYIGYFVAGYYFANFNLSDKCKKYLYILAFLSVLLTIIGTSILSLYFGKYINILYENLALNTAFVTFGIFILIKNNFKNSKFSPQISEKIIKISSLTFGIYLIHAFILSFLANLLKLGNFWNYAGILVPILAVVVFFISLFLIKILSKIAFFKKYAM
ncbi:acyltransferase family protein [uncultured Campylobacter sp.]|uniref:acyltransferase n=1 Tax=uncultured Campylobacter sp. TaxID=218934 RepID=UPI00261C56EF|nr:acyltransferase family protein [uncultured Campylobacter sp.]